VAVLAVGTVIPASSSALSPSVSSKLIGPRERPVISFTAERRVAGDDWYEVHVRAVRPKEGCEFYEEVAISYVFAGQAIAVSPRPWDTGKWCLGRWRGRIYLVHRESCKEGFDDTSFCVNYSNPVGRFWFRVIR
jgi:hypothetical protein